MSSPELTGGRSAPDCVRRLPEEPGVYRFSDQHGRVLYVGRAVRLRRRVRSYWGDLGDRRRLATMVRRVVRVEALVCAGDHEACWLERSLLEQSLPRWNRAVGGAEVPIYIGVDPAAPSPRLRLLHRPDEPAAARGRRAERPGDPERIYGPFLGGAKVRLLASALHRLLPLDYTGEQLTGAERELGRIRGVGAEDRDRILQTYGAVLERRPDAVAEFLDALRRRRDTATEGQSYEVAGRLQQELQAATWLLAPQRLAALVPAGTPQLELFGWHDGVLLQLSWVDGRIRRWQQRSCPAEVAKHRLAATPPSWRDFLQRNAELAVALQDSAPDPA